jgi:hypothetical protein
MRFFDTLERAAKKAVGPGRQDPAAMAAPPWSAAFQIVPWLELVLELLRQFT